MRKYGRSSLDYFKLWPDKSYFFSPSQRCFLSYRVGGNFAVVLADPVGPEEEIEDTISNFIRDNAWSSHFRHSEGISPHGQQRGECDKSRANAINFLINVRAVSQPPLRK